MRCKKCNEEKTADDFYSAGTYTKANGEASTYKHLACKSCLNKKSRKWYKENKLRRSINSKIYYENNKKACRATNKKWSEANKEKVKSSQIKYRLKHPERKKARTKVKTAIRNKTLTRTDCAYPNGRCEGNIDAHHWNYEKPLEVIWFCKKHHALADSVKTLLDKYNITYK
jgi:hypothetical protein